MSIRLRHAYVLLNAVLLVVFPFLPVYGQSTASPYRESISTKMLLLVLPVSVMDKESGKPIVNLRRTDFQVFDEGRPAKIIYFNAERSPRATVVWFTLDCPSAENPSQSAMRPANLLQAFQKLTGEYRFGVADWCDDGEAQIDLKPTQVREQAVAAMNAIRQRPPIRSSSDQSGVAFQKMLHLVADERGSATDARVSVVVLSDHGTELPRDKADLLSKRLVYSAMTVYGFDEVGQNRTGKASQSGSTLQFLTRQTGGRVIAVRNGDCLAAVERIFKEFESLYLLGTAVGAQDNSWHSVRIELTKDSLRTHPDAELRFRTGYLSSPFGSAPPYLITRSQESGDAEEDSGLVHAIDSKSSSEDIRFDVDVQAFTGMDDLLEFNLRVDGSQFSWATLPNGNKQSSVSFVVASFSSEGKRLSLKNTRLDLVRDEIHLAVTGDGPLVDSETVPISDKASSVRVAVRDAATGRVGVREFKVKELLDGPRKPAVIE